MSAPTVTDDFLSEAESSQLDKVLFSNRFPWFWNPICTTNPSKDPLYNKYNFQFVHLFFLEKSFSGDGVLCSSYMPHLESILSKLETGRLIRVKANMHTRTEDIVEFGMHVDVPDSSKTSILYLNTNNGYTKFEDDSKVYSVKNRLVTFPSRMKHAGTTCTDENFRSVINLNYV